MNEAIEKAKAALEAITGYPDVRKYVGTVVHNQALEALSALSNVDQEPVFAGRVFVDQLTGKREAVLSAEGKQLPDMARLYTSPASGKDARIAELEDALKAIDSLRGPFMSDAAIAAVWAKVDSALAQKGGGNG